MTPSEGAPWRGRDEPDYMPRLRRHFADSLPQRLARADRALRELHAGASAAGASAEGPEAVPPARAIHLFGHSLAGTAPSVDAAGIAAHGRAIAEQTRDWERTGPPGPEALEEVGRLVDRIRHDAETYRGWVADVGDD